MSPILRSIWFSINHPPRKPFGGATKKISLNAMIFFEDTPFPGYKRDPFLEVPYIYVFFFNVFSFFSVFWLKLLEEWCCGLFSFFFFAEILSIISLI